MEVTFQFFDPFVLFFFAVTVKSVEDLQEENKALRKEIESLMAAQASNMQGDLIASAKEVNGVKLITKRLDGMDNKTAKTLAFNVSKELNNSVVMFGLVDGPKVQLMLLITDSLIQTKELHAGNMIREIAKEVQGGGGGQPFFATAGGKNPDGLENAFAKLEGML